MNHRDSRRPRALRRSLPVGLSGKRGKLRCCSICSGSRRRHRSAWSPGRRWRTSPAWPPPVTTCWPRPGGTSRPTACSQRRSCTSSAARSGMPASTWRCATSGSVRAACTWCRPTTRAECAPTRYPRRWPAATARPSCARKPATSRPARAIRWPRSARPRTTDPANRPPGYTWTGRSGCGPRPARRCGTCAPASTRPTPGQSTRTSG